MAESRIKTLEVDGISVQVTWKKVRRLTLAVSPPAGDVRVSAPPLAGAGYIRDFIKSKISWIVRQREAMAARRAAAPTYADGERHMVWGNSCVLSVCLDQAHNLVELVGDTLCVSLRCGADAAHVGRLLANWRRMQVLAEAAGRVELWRGAMNLPPVALAVRQMRTRWGSCLPAKGKINLNSQLSKLPYECLDGVIVHELTHCIVPNHGAAFYDTMERYFPQWRKIRQMLKDAALNAIGDA